MSDRGESLPPDRWRRVKEVFGAALDRPPADRAAFLDQVCGTAEGDVRLEVEALLAAHQTSDGFLQTPASARLTPIHSELAEGETLGPYRVLRTLGHGGMATVYLARDERHRRSVALKVLHPDLAHALGAERFLREIEVAANLSHPHILPLFDSGEAAGLLYYVMPYVEGESLRDRLGRETHLPVDEALQFAREVADALAYAHGQGVIHRDIKPENILLSGGHALVADFGIARALGQAESGRLTESGMAIGTAAYMSPEQAGAASHIDGRSDVYSLGCVVYEMLAGEPPYTGPTALVIGAKRVTDPVPSIRRVRPAVPHPLDLMVMKALAPVPADRWPTAQAFCKQLGMAQTLAVEPPDRAYPIGTGTTVTTSAVRTARRSLVLGVLALGLMLVAVGLFWQRSRRPSEASAATARRLAVLPFENLGDSADSYFADGVTDAVRGKLVALSGLQVTDRASSSHYRKTSKTPQQIGQELGVQYLLTGTVRWEQAGEGTSRVQVTPELVQVASSSTTWQQPFDVSVTGVFQVQADIAARVAQALDVALSDSARRQLAEKPTGSLAAYDAYLKGQEVSQSVGSTDPAALRRAAAYYGLAVALDSGFVQAWAQLSRTRSRLYARTTAPAEGEAARRAAERALAMGPNRAEGQLALGTWHQQVANDNARAAVAFGLGLKIAPNNVGLLVASAHTEIALGRWAAAVVHLQQAQALDPRSIPTAGTLIQTLLRLRRYPEARAAAEHAVALAPTNMDIMEAVAMISLAQGDLAGARKVLAGAPKEVDREELVAFFANYLDLYWVLDDADRSLVLRLRPEAYDGDRGTWGIVLAETYGLQGDGERARSYADSARVALEKQVRAAPDAYQNHLALGLALAYLGRTSEALKEGRRGVELMPVARDRYAGAYSRHQLARIYLLLGEREQALDELEYLLAMPYNLSPGWLRIDPTFAPLRGDPRFERLLRGPPAS